jgi:hypothetical protein
MVDVIRTILQVVMMLMLIFTKDKERKLFKRLTYIINAEQLLFSSPLWVFDKGTFIVCLPEHNIIMIIAPSFYML